MSFAEAESKARAELYHTYRPEFINRFSGIVGFKTLAVDALFKVAEREVGKLNKQLSRKGMRLDIPDADITAMSEAVYDPAKNGRAMTS